MEGALTHVPTVMADIAASAKSVTSWMQITRHAKVIIVTPYVSSPVGLQN